MPFNKVFESIFQLYPLNNFITKNLSKGGKFLFFGIQKITKSFWYLSIIIKRSSQFSSIWFKKKTYSILKFDFEV